MMDPFQNIALKSTEVQNYRYILIFASIFCLGSGHGPPYAPGRCPTCPYFLNTPLNESTSVGASVNLTCGIRNLGDSKVSWIRRETLHVLTSELMTYTSDKRFRSLHTNGSPFWVLELSSPVLNDTGVYECQVSSQPIIYRRIKLNVKVPQASILGRQEVYMKAGSDINITCYVTGHMQPTHITWLHSINDSDSSIELNSGVRGGVQIITDIRRGKSWLLVSQATWRDAGSYTCLPKFSIPATVSVHVLHDEETAAMQPDWHNSSSPISSSVADTSGRFNSSSLALVVSSLILLIHLQYIFFAPQTPLLSSKRDNIIFNNG